MSIKRILLLPHLHIQNANALSSPYTIGFPALTAWLGAVHALQRKLITAGFEDLLFTKVGVVCHWLDLQTYKGRGDYVYSIIGTGNPLDKDGNRSAFIEEARCHLDVSLIIECEGVNPFTQNQLQEQVNLQLLGGLKFAGGDLLSVGNVDFHVIDDEVSERKLKRQLMPGYALIERRELMIEAMQQGQDALDALLDYLSIKHRSEIDDEGRVTWTSKRKTSGWLVPIATGFHGIAPLIPPGETLNQRDPETPHRFAEAVVTLGEFVMPYRLNALDELLWHYHYDEFSNLYLCQQSLSITQNLNV
ncbi:MAG: type I-F CRISPR-associated protein Csy2 [Gammaproteobacteria bacterium]|nr:type I-F CRISPR-associated protein Csy2 [Gammaproteobacteria bacterium]